MGCSLLFLGRVGVLFFTQNGYSSLRLNSLGKFITISLTFTRRKSRLTFSAANQTQNLTNPIMKRNIASQLIALSIAIFITACGQTQKQNETLASELSVENPDLETIEEPGLRIIEPTIGSTPDISVNAKKNFERIKEFRDKIDSIINTYPDYEAAQEHLTEQQIEIWENEEEYFEKDNLYVGTFGCSWYCGCNLESISASSTLAPYKNLDYKAENIHDFSLRTAWVEGVDGYGIGEGITFRFGEHSAPITTVIIYNGYMKSDKVWQDNSRVKQLKFYVDDKPVALLNLKDIKSEQIFAIDTLQRVDADRELYLKFEITDVYKGDKYDDVAISEIEFDGFGVHCFAQGTLVKTPNGEVEIEKLGVGDSVISYNALTKKTETATILELASQKHHNLYELNFSGTKLTVTEDHPFFLEDQYFSIMANHKYGLATATLNKGQQINFLIDGKIQTLALTDITKIDRCEMTYTITKLDRNKLFFANGACVATEEVSPRLAGNN